MDTLPEFIAAWRQSAAAADAEADGCDEVSRAQGKHKAYMARATALRNCADDIEAWWMAIAEGVTA